MGTLTVLIPWLALLHLQAASASSEAKPGCLGTCGDIEVPYPFGLGPNCSHGKDFSLTCDESVVPNCSHGNNFSPTCNESVVSHKLMWGGLQVFNLSVERGEMAISMPISYACYSGGRKMIDRSAYTNLIEHSTFTFSNKNRFTTIGCDTLGLFSGSWGKDFTGGCATYCSDLSSLNATSSPCDGVGCCQTAIPTGVSKADINISSFNNYSNLSPSANDLNCGYAFLVREDNFTFQPGIDLKEDQLHQTRPRMPVLVDWAIGGQGDTCTTSTSQTGDGGSGCLAKHSECISSAAGYGYRCNCSKGYYGNPYLENDGCQDINECDSDLHNCISKDACVNTGGGYLCECPDGQKGNGTKGGEGCKPDIPVAYKAVATCVSIMFLLLGVGRLVVRFNLMPKWVINAIKKESNHKEPVPSSSTGEDMRRNAKKKKRYPVVEEEYLQAAKKCKEKLRTLIAENRCAPIMLCLAWQDVNAKTGKPFGTITHQFADEDINKAVSLLAKLKVEHPFNNLSNADIFQLAGVMAVEVAGSPHVAFHPGREDNAENMPPHDIGNKDSIVRYLREVLIDSSLSLCVHDIVAISPWLRCNKDCSGFQFTWPPTFDNSYFKQLISVIGEKESLPDHDQALLVDTEFFDFVRKYAEDEASFFAAYAKSHMKFSELGFADAD